jgi:hypothetical protein
MRKKTWSSTLRQLTKNLEDTWDDLVHDDTSQIEREFNRLVGRLQRRHGYAPERALKELQSQWNSYSKRTQSLIEKQMAALPGRKKKRRISWPWLVVVAVGGLYVANKVARLLVTSRQPDKGQQQTQAPAPKPKDADGIDERSWESFPASDPPATW